MLGAALPVAIWAKARKSHLLRCGAPLHAGLLVPVPYSAHRHTCVDPFLNLGVLSAPVPATHTRPPHPPTAEVHTHTMFKDQRDNP